MLHRADIYYVRAAGCGADRPAGGPYHVRHAGRARNLRPPDCADITTVAVTDLTTATIRRREVLGGLIHEYEKAA